MCLRIYDKIMIDQNANTNNTNIVLKYENV